MNSEIFFNTLSVMAKERLEETPIGNMIKLTIDNNAISFTAGEPSSDIYPIDELKTAFSTIFDDIPLLAYYPEDFGLTELRNWIVKRMKIDKMAPEWVTEKNILLTNGAGEAINLVAETFIDPGSIVLTEAPTFTETLLTFRKQGAQCVGIASDDEGILPNELEKALKTRKPRMLYTIPNFQNPSGRTTSLQRRKEILALATKYNIPIFEDDPYHYLSYDGEPPMTYLALAGENRRVIHANSFSKVVAPGMRTGWAVIPDEVIPHFTSLRVNAGLTRPAIIQKGIYNYLTTVNFEERINFLRDTYRARRDGMMNAIKRHLLPLGIKTNYPLGGFFLWGENKNIDDMTKFAKFAVKKHKIGIIPGDAFYSQDEAVKGKQSFRISFAKVNPQTAEEGISRLAKAFMEYEQGEI
ncbi:MAG: PLP-dependent aminotransferase family protein [Synergistaceae bacterium]